MPILHLFSSYNPTDPDTCRRHRVAKLTWSRQPWEPLGINNDQLQRSWKEDGRSFPYIRDLFDAAISGHDPETIICYTNSDIMVRGDCCMLLSAVMQGTDACYSYRRDFQHRIETPIPDEDYIKGMPYAGSDLFAFRVRWWREYRPHMPDMILGFEAYDPVLRLLAERTNKGAQTHLPDVICHERHGTMWEHPKNRYRLRAQLHNLALAKSFLKSNGVNPAVHGIR